MDFYPSAIVASTIANVNRGKGKALIGPDRFMPEFGKGIGESPVVQSTDDIKKLMMGLVKVTDPKRKKKRKSRVRERNG